MLSATFVASMVVLDRTVRASATEWLPLLLRSLSVPMLMVDPMRMLSAVSLAMMTRLALDSALVTALCGVVLEASAERGLHVLGGEFQHEHELEVEDVWLALAGVSLAFLLGEGDLVVLAAEAASIFCPLQERGMPPDRLAPYFA